MEVILRQDIDKVGLRGEVVNVARLHGYGLWATMQQD